MALKTVPARGLRVLLAPDSFKGSLDAPAAARHMAEGIRNALPDARVTQVPIADGGEGTAAVVAAACGGCWHAVDVTDANGQLVRMPFAACESAALGAFAIFDVAAVAGLPDAMAAPGARTTRGVGQAIRGIAAQGFATIVVGLGGSSTNDAGAGLLAELALDFLDAAGGRIDPVLDNLASIRSLRPRADAGRWQAPRLVALTDVTSPLCGRLGASMIFGAQKGVTDLAQADEVLGEFAARCELALGRHAAQAQGAGAAGGLGFALRLLGAQLLPGGSFILDAAGLATVAGYDWILTGEGRSDRQTLLGKGPALIAALGRRHGVPVTLLSGRLPMARCCARRSTAASRCRPVLRRWPGRSRRAGHCWKRPPRSWHGSMRPRAVPFRRTTSRMPRPAPQPQRHAVPPVRRSAATMPRACSRPARHGAPPHSPHLPYSPRLPRPGCPA
ncbi:glycerate kinase [Cupriavidus sp. D39]|nr:glycerate kinase [Cupriavidus sp. D39]